MSDQLSALAATRAVMQEVTSVSKDDQFNGGQTRYAYRGVDRVVKAISASMRKHGLVIVPFLKSADYQAVSTSTGKPAQLTTVVVEYEVFGPDGTSFSTCTPGESIDSSDKGVSKAMSVAWRTMLLQTFFLPTEEPDPDSENTELGTPAQTVPSEHRPAVHPYDEKVAKYDKLVADWQAAIDERKDNLTELQKLYNDARAKRVPQTILDMIKAEGEKCGNRA